jgi:hypothetical protein
MFDSPFGSTAKIKDNPLAILKDGSLAQNYDIVFTNGVADGAFKMDLGDGQMVQALSAWSFHQNGSRGRQLFTGYGSNSVTGIQENTVWQELVIETAP